MEDREKKNWQKINKDRWLHLHPLSGATVLLLDNVFFGLNVVTAGFGTPISMVLAFCTTLPVVWFVQRKIVGECRGMCLGKSLAAAVIAGLPFSIAGTALGAWVLLSAGLSPWRRLLK